MQLPPIDTDISAEEIDQAASQLYPLIEQYYDWGGMNDHIRRSWPDIASQINGQMNALGDGGDGGIEPNTISLQGEDGLTIVKDIEVQGATTMPAVINLEDGSPDGLLKRLAQIGEANLVPAPTDSPVVNLIYVNTGDLTTQQLQGMLNKMISDTHAGQSLSEIPGTMTIIGGDVRWAELLNDQLSTAVPDALGKMGINYLSSPHGSYLSMVKFGMVAYQTCFDKTARDILQKGGLEASDTNVGRIQARANYIFRTMAHSSALPE